MSTPFVAILMGSDGDFPQIEPTLDTLRKLKIGFEVKLTCAQRTPDVTQAYVKEADKRGCAAFICSACNGTYLAEFVAANTITPVVDIPSDNTVPSAQTEAGMPVANLTQGKAGAKNAAFLAAQMMALSDADLAGRLREERAANAKIIEEKDAALQARLSQQS